MENTATSSVEHTPWIAEIMTHGKDAGMYQVVNSKGWVIAECMVKEEAEFFAATPKLLETLQALIEMAHSVAANWENGNLAFAVNNLGRIATEAETVVAEATGTNHDHA